MKKIFIILFLTICHFNKMLCCKNYFYKNPAEQINKNVKQIDGYNFIDKNFIINNDDQSSFLKLSTKKIVNLNLELTNITKEVSRDCLVMMKYRKLDSTSDTNANSKISNIYRLKYKKNIKILKNFIKNNENSLASILWNAKRKKIDLDEELFNLTYKCALGFTKNKNLLNHKTISSTYHKNKNNKNNKKILESRLQLLEKIFEKNTQNEISDSNFDFLKKFDHLVKKLYLTQLNLETACLYNYNTQIVIQNMKKNSFQTHDFLKDNIVQIQFLLKINSLNPQRFFQAKLFQDKIEFVEMTYNFLQFLLKGINIPYIKNLRYHIIEQDQINKNNRIGKIINSIKNTKKLIDKI